MLLSKCNANPEKFNKSSYKNFKISSEDKTVSLSLESLSSTITQFWTALALCHDCNIQVDEDGREDYIGMSTDSIELIRAARLQGYQLTKAKTSKYRRIKTESYKPEIVVKSKEINENKEDSNSNNQDYKLLNIIPFS